MGMELLEIIAVSSSVGACVGALVGFGVARFAAVPLTPQLERRNLHPVVVETLIAATENVRKVTPQAGPSWRKTKAKLEGLQTSEQKRGERVKKFTGDNDAS